MLGRAADLVMLDMTDPQRPRARALSAALARIVRARAVNPRFIAGQMRHGPRGAAELAETVDRLVAFAETTDAVAGELFDLLHDAYVADPDVRDFLLRENPQAAAAIAERLDDGAAARLLASAPQRRRRRPRGAAKRRPRHDSLTRNARGACPGLSAPMPTGDGLLVRLLPIGTVPLAAFAELCAAARKHGNGVDRNHRARQHPGARLERCVGAAVRGGHCRARHRGGGRRPGSLQCARRSRRRGNSRCRRAGRRFAPRAGASDSLATRLAPKVSVAIDGGGALGS